MLPYLFFTLTLTLSPQGRGNMGHYSVPQNSFPVENEPFHTYVIPAEAVARMDRANRSARSAALARRRVAP